MNKLALYQAFIKEVSNSIGSWENYSQFNRIDKIIKALHPGYKDLIEYDDVEFVKGLYNELISLPELPTEQETTFKQLGHGQYHNAMLTYIQFLKACRFFNNNKIADKRNVRNEKEQTLQQIYYGAPGTGKSHEINRLTKGESVIRTTFHPDSDYSTFVGAYKPVMSSEKAHQVRKMSLTALASKLKDYYNDEESGKIEGIQQFVIEYQNELKGIKLKQLVQEAGISENYKVEIDKYMSFCNNIPRVESKIEYRFVAQAFIQAYVKSWRFFAANPDKPQKQYLIIEEINRGNCAQIFGDLFQLLDRNENGYSSYVIMPDSDLQTFLAQQKLEVNGVKDNKEGTDISDKINNGVLMSLPPNLYIWATMNTSDQSLFPIDSAFKRRWDWKYVPINTRKESWSIDVNGVMYSWSSFLEKINYEIGEQTSSEDKKLGFYFCKAENGVISAERFVSKVLFYIYNDVFKDYEFDREFFKRKNESNKLITFQSLYDCESGEVNQEVVAELLDNLGVTLSDNTELIDDGVESDTQTEKKDGTHYYIESITVNDELFPFDDRTKRYHTYISVLRKIGVDTLLPTIGSYGYHRNHVAVVTKEVVDIGKKQFSYIPIDDEWYLMKGVVDDTLIAMLERAIQDLQLNVVINKTRDYRK